MRPPGPARGRRDGAPRRAAAQDGPLPPARSTAAGSALAPGLRVPPRPAACRAQHQPTTDDHLSRGMGLGATRLPKELPFRRRGVLVQHRDGVDVELKATNPTGRAVTSARSWVPYMARIPVTS